MSIPDSGDFDHARAPYPAPQTTTPAGPTRLFRWYDLLLMGLILALGQVPGVVAGVVLAISGSVTIQTVEHEGLPPSVIIIALAGSGIVLFLGCILMRRMRGIDWATLGMRSTTVRPLVAAVLAYVAYVVIAESIGRIFQVDPDGEFTRQLAQQLIPPGAGLPYIALAVAFAGVIVPVAEEILFRGFLLTWLRERSNAIVTVIVSSLLFSAVHFYFLMPGGEFGIFASAGIFVLGLLLGWLAIWSRSLWPPIVLHVINNLVVVVIAIGG